MRLPWFSSRPKRGKSSGKSRRRKPTSLRVRPLERRRVLNASIQSIAVPSAAAEGSSVTATANATGQGQLNYNWSFTQGNTTLATGTNPSFNFTVPDDGNYNVSLTVTDNSPVSDAKSVGILGKNVAPVLSAAKDQTVDEGHSLDLTGNSNPILGLFIDDGKLDTHTATVDWGDGSPIGVPTVSEANGSGTLSGSHTYAEAGTYTVTVNVQDDNGGGSGPQTFKVLVNNVPPQLVNVTGSTINENGIATVTATIQDPGTQDTFSVAVNWQDFAGDTITGLGASNTSGFIGDTGYQWTAATRQLTLTHQYADDGPSPGNGTLSDTNHVALSVTDNHLDSTSTNVDVIVNNVNPKLMLAGDQTLNEGQALNLSGISAPVLGIFTDVGTHDQHTATVDWGDGSGVQTPVLAEAAGSGVLTATHLYADNGTYTVTATVTDDDGGSDTETFKVTVKNVAPTFDSLSITTPINENDFATLSGTYHDPGVLDTQTLDIDWDGDGNFDQSAAVSGGAFSIQHQYLDDGPSPGNGTASDQTTVHVRLRDNGGDSSTGQTVITVNNLKPVLTATKDKTVDEGQLLDLTGNANPLLGLFIDAGTLDQHTATVDWGDGSPVEAAIVNEANGSGSLGGSHTYADDGTFTVKVNVSDDDLGTSDVETFKVMVNNVPPQLVNVTGSTINENGIATVTATIQDPGTQDTFSVAVNWQDFASDTITGLGASNTSGFIGDTGYQWTAATRQLTLTHQYVDDGPSPGNGTLSDTYHVALTATDNHLDSGLPVSVDVIVNNVNPQLTLAGDQTLNEGQTLNLSGMGTPILGVFTDVGMHDKHTATVDWGDGSGVQTPTLSEAAGSGVITGTHTYADDGTYTVTATVTDDDGGSDTKTFKVTVNNIPPQFVNVTGSTIDENSVATITAKVQDPGVLDSFAIDVNWLDGSATDHVTGLGAANSSGTVGTTSYQWTAATRQITLSHQYLDDGLSPGNGTANDTYHVALTVTDNFPSSTSTTADVTVDNLPPVLTVTKDKAINEGQLLDLTGNANPLLGLFIDTGTLDQHTATVDWGDGSPVEAAVVNEAGGSGSVGGSHTYADDGIYTVKVTVSDDDLGTSDVETFKVTVSNQNPTLTVTPTPPTTIFEGSSVAFNASFSDPGFDNPANPTTPATGDRFQESFTYDVNWGDGRDALSGVAVADTNGSPGTPSTGSFNGSHTYADDGTYTVTVTIHDDNGGSDVKTFTVTVNNQNPTLTVTPTPPTTIFEGSSVSFNAAFSDPGFDNPANPTTPATGDPLNESFTYDVNWGDGRDAVSGVAVADTNGSPGTPSTGSFNGSHTYADDGVYTVTVTIHDDNGGGDVKTFTVTVSNQNPTLIVTPTPPTTIFEGSSVAFNATFSDPGFDNPANPTTPATGDPLHESFTYDVNWGDGRDAVSGVAVADTNGSPGIPSTGSFNGSHTYADDGTYTVTVTIHDDNGGSDVKTFTVTVNNQNPTLTVTPTPPTTIFEGSSVAFNASFSDPGFDNPANPTTPATGDRFQESFTYDVNWGDGRDAVSGVAVADTNGSPGIPSTGSFNGSHTYADDGTYTVTVTIHDDNGGSDVKTFTVTVNNQNPTLTVTPTPPTTIFEGSSVAFNATFSDPGFDNPANPTTPATGDPLQESFTYDVNWGDGRDALSGVAVADTNGSPGTPSTGSFNGSHTYADDGVYTVTVTIHDDNGGSDVETFTVTVNNQNPTLTVTPTPPTTIFEGSSVAFNATFSDPGFDNPANPTTPATGDPLQESFTYDVNWGDGRDALSGVAVADTNGSPGTPSTGLFNGSHTYADDGTYTVTVTIHDDNGGSDVKTFTVTVNNVDPTLTGTSNLHVNEGQAFTLKDLGVGLEDPGFDNPNNPTTPATGDPLAETFTGFTIDWGDGQGVSEPVSIDNVNDRVSGSPGVKTTAKFTNAAYTYADDGVYTVTITLKDDNGPVVSRQFQITVLNVVPTLTLAVGNQTSVEAGTVTLPVMATFTDPGFDNPNNPTTPTLGDPKNESFRYFIDWGDGREQVATMPVADTNGSPGVPSSGQFGGSHNYADNGTYTVTLRIADDNMSGNFAAGTVGVDYIEQTFKITVSDIAPSFVKPNPVNDFSGTAVDIHGLTSIKVAYSEPGYDNFANASHTADGGQFAETPVYVVDWGDGTVDAMHHYAVDGSYTVTVTVTPDGGSSQTFTFNGFDSATNPVLTLVSGQTLHGALKPYTFVIDWGDNDGTAAKNGAHAVTTMTLMLADPGIPVVNSGLTKVMSTVRTSGQGTVNSTVATTGSTEIQHRYVGPPDPLNPTANIEIQTTVFDDDGLSTATSSIFITNPGINSQMIRIDTTPDIARLEFPTQAAIGVFVGPQSTSTESLQNNEVIAAAGEMAATADRYLELRVVYPDGTEGQGYRMKDESLNDLRGFFQTLPDGRYRVYLVRTENNSRRLVIEVNVRRGNVIDVSDESEGTRDRPPTSEDQGQQPKPLNENPQLEAVPGGFGDTAPSTSAATATADANAPVTAPPMDNQSTETSHQNTERSQSESAEPARRAMPLAAAGIAAASRPWSEEVDEALAGADDENWQRLRHAVRRGRFRNDNRERRIRRPVGRI